jgi:N-acetylglucosamine-6-phosphate deacetylase
MALTLCDTLAITPREVTRSAMVVVSDDGRIVYIGPGSGAPRLDGDRLRLPGHIVTPGFIDIHTHGGSGITFGQDDDLLGALRVYSSWAATTGVTGFLCSVAAPDAASLRVLVQSYAEAFSHECFAGAQPLGLHLEGPYLNPEKKGAFNPAWLRRPLIEEVQELVELGQGWIRQMTLAPELAQATETAAVLQSLGVVPALGHSNTDYATAAAALTGAFTHVTHTFNAQRGFHHREPGVLGAVLSSDGVTAELIADTVHVHPGAMKVMMRCLGSDRVVLITDAMAAAGLGDGQYELVGKDVFVNNGVARQTDGTVAGSTATLSQCIRNMVRTVGVSLKDAVTMATLNPARVLDLDDHHGILASGRNATLAVMDQDLNVVMTLVNGQIVHSTLLGGR